MTETKTKKKEVLIMMTARFTKEQRSMIRKMAARTKLSENGIIREAVSHYYNERCF